MNIGKDHNHEKWLKERHWKSMNRSGSYPSHENPANFGYWEGSPPQGLSEARRGKFEFWENRRLKPPRERPRGGGGTYRNGGMGASAPIIFI
jgi:hypothetical protein